MDYKDKIVDVNGSHCPECGAKVGENIRNRLAYDPEAIYQICHECGVTIQIGLAHGAVKGV